jgi:hypothetical protein
MLGAVALFVCEYFKFDDRAAEIDTIIQSVSDADTGFNGS